uniref:DUF5648 domain-containing protein n=1 Tax=Amphimedon queenslandica TaxID=400682 RepID=A0A1X7UWI2_AMPQE
MKATLVFLAAVLVTIQCLPSNVQESNSLEEWDTIDDSNGQELSVEEKKADDVDMLLENTILSADVKTEGCSLVPLYRYHLSSGNDHFYTTNPHEIGTTRPGTLGRYGYRSQGTVGKIYNRRAGPDVVPLFRYWNSGIKDHFYTTNFNELACGAHGWKYEGIQGYCFKDYLPGINHPLYRYWSGNDHFYTTNPHEIGTTTPGAKGKHGYTSEGITCYVA